MTTTFSFYDNITGEKVATKNLESFQDAAKMAENLESKHDTTIKIYQEGGI